MPAIPQDVLTRTPVVRIVHIDCLQTLLSRGVIHAPSAVPTDGLSYVGIHARDVQEKRGDTPVTCGPGGTIRDYVGFYFGPRSPMLYRIQTGHNVPRVAADDIVYLVAIAQDIARAGLSFVFTDRHSLTRLAASFDDLRHLNCVSFPHAYAEYWSRTPDEPDRQERKQAEFLVHHRLPWDMIVGLGVHSEVARRRVADILNQNPNKFQPKLLIKRNWFY